VASWEPLGVLFGTSGGAFGLPKRALGGRLGRPGRFWSRLFGHQNSRRFST